MDAVEQKIKEWLDWLMIGKSPTTVVGYAWDVRALVRAVPKESPGDYTLADVTGYVAERLRAGKSAGGTKRAVAAFRSFFGYCGLNFAEAVPFPKIRKRKQRALDFDRLLAVAAACEPTKAVGLRDLTLICLMTDSGIRCSEVCRLQLADVDLERLRFSVVVKGGEELDKKFNATTRHYLELWISERAKLVGPGVATLFCGVGGMKPGSPLTPGGLRAIFRKIGKRAGLANGFSPHDLRRTFGNLHHLLNAPLESIKAGGGWSSYSQMKPYMGDVDLDVLARYSPVDHILGTGQKPG